MTKPDSRAVRRKGAVLASSAPAVVLVIIGAGSGLLVGVPLAFALSRRPALAVVNATAWGGLVWWCLCGDGPAPMLPVLLVVSTVCLILFVIDLDVHRLPNGLVYALYPVTILGLGVAGILAGAWAWQGAIAGAAIWTATIGTLNAVTHGRGMGMGDVKLSPVLGALVGWVDVGACACGLLAAFCMGGCVAVALIATGRARRGTVMAFGPFLISGAAIGLLWGPEVADWYLGSAGLSALGR